MMLISPLRQLSRCPLDGAQNSYLRAAAAQVSRQGFFDLHVFGFGVFIEQRIGGHDPAIASLSTT
jgi:hypothetical protein